MQPDPALIALAERCTTRAWRQSEEDPALLLAEVQAVLVRHATLCHITCRHQVALFSSAASTAGPVGMSARACRQVRPVCSAQAWTARS